MEEIVKVCVKNKCEKKLARYLKKIPIDELPDILNGYYVSVFRSAYKEFGNLSTTTQSPYQLAQSQSGIPWMRVPRSPQYLLRSSLIPDPKSFGSLNLPMRDRF